MYQIDVHYAHDPGKITVMPLSNGVTDVWMRKGVGSVEKADDAGNTFTDYFAEEEAYARLPSEFVAGVDLEKEFDSWYPKIRDDVHAKTITDEDRLSIVEAATEENTLGIEELVLAIADLKYGGNV